MKLWIAAVFFGFLPILVVGCGARTEGPARFSINGTVTLDSKPIESGSILFVDPNGKVQSYFASIKNGSYQTEMEAGKWDVQITATRESKDKLTPNAEGTGMVPVSEQYIPLKYNEKTELQITVEQQGENVFPFDLVSK